MSIKKRVEEKKEKDKKDKKSKKKQKRVKGEIRYQNVKDQSQLCCKIKCAYLFTLYIYIYQNYLSFL